MQMETNDEETAEMVISGLTIYLFDPFPAPPTDSARHEQGGLYEEG